LIIKVDYEATVEIGIARISRINRAKIGYYGAFSFHHVRMSNSSFKLASSKISGSKITKSESVILTQQISS
jgi:hypothetical protein